MNTYQKIERTLDKLLVNPSDAQLYNKIGVLLYKINDIENSYMYLEKAYQLCSQDKDIMYNYGLVLYCKYKLKESKLILEQYIKYEPEDLNVLEKLVDIYYRLGEYKMASTKLCYINKLIGGKN